MFIVRIVFMRTMNLNHVTIEKKLVVLMFSPNTLAMGLFDLRKLRYWVGRKCLFNSEVLLLERT